MTQALETLLPCPWCQNPGVEVAHTDFYWAVCQDDDCQAEGPVRRTEAEAITAWNTRKPCDAGLREALTGAREYVADALDAHEHSDGRELLNRIDAALSKGDATR